MKAGNCCRSDVRSWCLLLVSVRQYPATPPPLFLPFRKDCCCHHKFLVNRCSTLVQHHVLIAIVCIVLQAIFLQKLSATQINIQTHKRSIRPISFLLSLFSITAADRASRARLRRRSLLISTLLLVTTSTSVVVIVVYFNQLCSTHGKRQSKHTHRIREHHSTHSTDCDTTSSAHHHVLLCVVLRRLLAWVPSLSTWISLTTWISSLLPWISTLIMPISARNIATGIMTRIRSVSRCSPDDSAVGLLEVCPSLTSRVPQRRPSYRDLRRRWQPRLLRRSISVLLLRRWDMLTWLTSILLLAVLLRRRRAVRLLRAGVVLLLLRWSAVLRVSLRWMISVLLLLRLVFLLVFLHEPIELFG